MLAAKPSRQSSAVWQGATKDGYTLRLTRSALTRVISQLKQTGLEHLVKSNNKGNLEAAVVVSIAQVINHANASGTVSSQEFGRNQRAFTAIGKTRKYQVLSQPIDRKQSAIIFVRSTPIQQLQNEFENEYEGEYQGEYESEYEGEYESEYEGEYENGRRRSSSVGAGRSRSPSPAGRRPTAAPPLQRRNSAPGNLQTGKIKNRDNAARVIQGAYRRRLGRRMQNTAQALSDPKNRHRGKFDMTVPPQLGGSIRYRPKTNTRFDITSYQVYDNRGFPVQRVDVNSRDHKPIVGPHVHKYRTDKRPDETYSHREDRKTKVRQAGWWENPKQW